MRKFEYRMEVLKRRCIDLKGMNLQKIKGLKEPNSNVTTKKSDKSAIWESLKRQPA